MQVERIPMANAHRTTTTVRADGKIEVAAPQLSPGQVVEVTIRPADGEPRRRSALDILSAAPGHRLFKTPADVDQYVRGERDAWDR
jgi:hypothetical protein